MIAGREREIECRGCCFCEPEKCDRHLTTEIGNLIKLYSQCFYVHRCKRHKTQIQPQGDEILIK